MGNYSDVWVAQSRRRQTAEPGICPDCGARLSVYRYAAETRCAPCVVADRLMP
jgi:hypothetical protein